MELINDCTYTYTCARGLYCGHKSKFGILSFSPKRSVFCDKLDAVVTFWYTPHLPVHIRGIHKWNTHLYLPQGCTLHQLASTAQPKTVQGWSKCLYLHMVGSRILCIPECYTFSKKCKEKVQQILIHWLCINILYNFFFTGPAYRRINY